MYGASSSNRSKGVLFARIANGPLFKGKRVARDGRRSNSGIEAANRYWRASSSTSRALEVCRPLRADEVLQRRRRSMPNIKNHHPEAPQTTEVRGDGKQGGRPAYTESQTSAESKQVDVGWDLRTDRS